MKRLVLTIFLTGLLALALTGYDRNLTDHDGNTYRMVKIGSQTWMAENLKVRTEGSWCYEDKESNCQKYGRLYNWDAAKVACPVGWHLPSKEEFKILLKFVGGVQDKEDAWEWKDVGKKLNSSSGWKENGNGDDAFGYSVLPAGGRSNNGGYYGDGYNACFWSSTEDDSGSAYNMCLNYDVDYAYLPNDSKGDGYSVRCVKD